ncbi:hypothetical protein FRC00_008341 [Tulasnella sp. 408]|nr:hypothetical protein FRC00_008341 [Tulasnella sp. 408]
MAVKKMKLKTQDDTVRILGFTLREAEFLVRLSHENVIKLEGFVEDASKGLIWLVFPPGKKMINDVAGGVAHIHGTKPPICHGDLKSVSGHSLGMVYNGQPTYAFQINVLVNSKCRAVITDFGSARHPVVNGPNKERERTNEEFQPAPSLEATLDPSTNTITLTCSHYTVRWAAPELLEEDDASLACDIWSFGWVAYEPRIIPKPLRAADAENQTGDSANLLIQLGNMYRYQSDYSSAAKYYARALSVYSDIADTKGKANALLELADIQLYQEEYSQAVVSFSEALKLLIDIEDNVGRAGALLGLAQVHRVRNEYNQAIQLYSECLQIYTDVDDKVGRASALWGLAEVHLLRKEYDQAIKFYSECLRIRTDIGDRRRRMEALWGLADAHRLRKEYSQAMKLLSDALIIAIEIGNKYWNAFILHYMALVHHDQHDHKNAMHHYEQAAVIYKQIGHANEAIVLRRAAEVRRLIRDSAA